MGRVLRSKLSAALLLAVALASAISLHTQAQSEPARYFPETGHTVKGEFLLYFDQHGGLRIFGFPITDEFDWNGRRVQYFQKARMELHPENPPTDRVVLGPLGDELDHHAPPDAPTANDPYHRYFPETGHTVAYAFLNFYNNYGGTDVLGYPITNFRIENSWIVQYFQRVELVWHPELSGDQRVQLGNLGLLHFDAAGLDPALLSPHPAPGLPGQSTTPTAIKVIASVRRSIIGRSGSQTLYVFVTDQQAKGLAQANVSYVIHDGSGDRPIQMPPTGTNGLTTDTFDIHATRPGQIVVIEVRAGYLTLSATGETLYLTWY